MKYKYSYILLLLGLVFWGCDSGNKDGSVSEKKRLQITATTGMIKDAIVNIVKDSADVIAIMGPGVDPHLYKATQGDLGKLNNADVIFYNGLFLEGKMGEILERMGRTRPVIAAAENISKDKLRGSSTYQDEYDPHVWFDVRLWKEVVSHISSSLQRLDSVNAAFYIANTNRYLTRLDSLHQTVREQVSTIPEAQRVLITSHDAFGYFGDAYGMEVAGLQGLSTASEAGLKDRVDLVNMIIERQINAVFIETSVSERAIKAVVEGCQKKGFDVKIGGSLYSDAMGEEGTSEGTYVGMVNANVQKIVNALR
ncbi:MAG: zinc ABC transporter substrate-binding protein [Bacteroidota bacterium]